MFVSVNVNFTKYFFAVFMLAMLAPINLSAKKVSLGKPATDQQISGWDIDIRPDGLGLPEGNGDAVVGEDIFINKCASCHGEFGEGAGRYPALAGGHDSLASQEPVKTVGSYWPYASTIFDYVRRAMPYGQAQSLSNDEVYAITAYILYSNDLIAEDFIVDQQSLPKIEMPNRYGFISDQRPDVPTGKPCMKNCLTQTAKVIGKARQVDVTPDEINSESEKPAVAKVTTVKPDASRGKKIFSQCAACHSLRVNEHRVGPSLSGIVGRKAGQARGFKNYSAVLKLAKTVWTPSNLNEFLTAPQTFMPGNSMPFAGLKNATELADLIEYLRLQAETK